MTTTVMRWWSALRRRYWLALGFDVMAIVLVFWLIQAWQTRDLPINQPAPATVLASLGGLQHQSAITAGQAGVVYFFAPWCGVCRHSISNLDALVGTGSIAWATSIALDYADEQEVTAFVEDTGITLPVLLGHAGTAADWGVRAFPTYYVIDAAGQISSRSIGYSTWLGLRARAGLASR